mgnify:CR=1 FL=1
MEVKGTFNAQRFFETLALILSERENAKITVKVTQQQEKQEEDTTAAGQQPKNNECMDIDDINSDIQQEFRQISIFDTQ